MNVFSTLQQQNLIPSASPVNNGQSAEEIAKANAEAEKVDFLNLLLTQLSNQNPLDPLDTKDFTAQLTRYSILEQGIETNEKLAVTNDLLKSSATAASFTYIGKEVEVETNMNTVQDNMATWSYLVDGDASQVKLTVTDENGTRLGEYDGSISSGVQSFSLDTSALDLQDGAALYISVNANAGLEGNLKSRVTSQIVVDGVWSNNKQNYLTSGSLSFRTSDVLKVIDSEDPAQQIQPTT